jgi:Fe-S-cluster-containing dehydrogenase component
MDSRLLELRQIPFQSALKKHRQVKTRLEAAYSRRALSSMVRRSRYFGGLPEETLNELVDSSTVADHKKGDLIIEEGGSAQKFYVIRSGFVRVTRRTGPNDEHEILAYLGPDDFFGDQELAAANASYQTSVVALEPVQLMAVPRATFWRLYQKHPDVFAEFRRYELTRQAGQSILQNSATSMAFVKDMLEAGLGQARSALIIDMDHCVRCGNCVQACDDLHGFSRLARRGKRMTRRVNLESARHEHLYFPTSCLQCATPECMVGCPTGAISRDPGGEVFIRDTCIGCGSCARNCDFGNISMAQVREEESFSLLGRAKTAEESTSTDESGGKEVSLLAVKCDVCFQRDYAACVYNCPTQAILRIDPRAYFEELKRIAPRASTQTKGAEPIKTQLERPSRWLDGVLQVLALVLAVGGGLHLYRRLGADAVAQMDISTGVASTVVFVLLGALGARKRIRTRALGSLFGWARIHAILGGLFVGLVLFHAGYAATSVLTATLLATILLVSLLGVAGSVANAVIPRIIARSQEESLLPEDIGPRVELLERENTELLYSVDELSRARVQKQVDKLVVGGWQCLIQGLGPSRLAELAEKRAQKLPAIAEREHAVSVRVAQNIMTARLYRAQNAVETLLLSWLPVHLVGAAAAGLLLVGHVITSLLW